MTKSEIAKYIAEIRAICQADINDFESNTPQEQSKRKVRAREDFEFFCHTYLPNYFTSPSASFHHTVDRSLEKRSNDVIICIGPREHAKTVRWNIAYIIHQIVFKKRRFIICVSETEDMAIKQLLNIRVHLESNSRLRGDFGSFQGKSLWSENEFITMNNVKVLARGYKQPVRGLLFGPNRPDLIRIDDISNLKSSKNEFLEKEKCDWILSELFGCMASNGTLFWTENINRRTSAVAQAKNLSSKGQDIEVFHFSAIENGQPLWPERYTLEFFEDKKKKIGTALFEREYMQNPVTEGTFYKLEWFRRFEFADASRIYSQMKDKIIYIDPSYGKKKKTSKDRGSDKKVAVVMGCKGEDVYLFDAISQQMSIDAFCKAVCYLYDKWRVKKVYYEGNFGQDMIVGKFLNDAERITGIRLPLKPYYTRASKEDRIEFPAPFVERGQVYVVKNINDVEDILSNLELYPDIEFDDPADAFGTGFEIIEANKHTVRAFFRRKT